MPKAIWNFSFKPKKGVKQEAFIEPTKKLHDEILSKAKGFISWKQYLQGDTWTDLVIWETLEDANNATTVAKGSELSKKIYAMIQMNTCRALISKFVIQHQIFGGLL